MADEEKNISVQENEQPAENTAAADGAGNFGEDAGDNFGEVAANDFEDNFGLGDAQLSAGTIPSPQVAPKKRKEPASPVTPREREPQPSQSQNQLEDDDENGPTISVSSDVAKEQDDDAPRKREKSREEELYEAFQLMRVPPKICEFVGEFRPYLAQHPDALEKLEPMLCDEESVTAVRVGMKRLEAFPPPEFQKVMFYYPRGMTLKREREDWEAHRAKYPEYAKLTNGEYSYYNPPEFFYRHGAIFLDSAVTERLAGGIFYQCGAFCGASLIAMNQYKPEMMYGFEPSLGHMMFVRANIEHAGIRNLELYRMCISDQEGKVFLSDRDQKGMPCRSEAPMTSLDLFEQKKNVQGRVAWIQADVNGMGLHVIKGAENMIKRDKPLISVAIYHNPDEFFGIVPLLHEWVPEYKFMVRRCQCNPSSTYTEITLIAYIP